MNDEDGPGWEMQDDNERRRWEEEDALERSRKLTAEFKASNEEFERESSEHHARFAELTRS